jgi:hypothetical protein
MSHPDTQPKCWPWSHDWRKWQTIERGELLHRHSTEPIIVGCYENQRRECKKCGKSQLREIRA